MINIKVPFFGKDFIFFAISLFISEILLIFAAELV